MAGAGIPPRNAEVGSREIRDNEEDVVETREDVVEANQVVAAVEVAVVRPTNVEDVVGVVEQQEHPEARSRAKPRRGRRPRNRRSVSFAIQRSI